MRISVGLLVTALVLGVANPAAAKARPGRRAHHSAHSSTAAAKTPAKTATGAATATARPPAKAAVSASPTAPADATVEASANSATPAVPTNATRPLPAGEVAASAGSPGAPNAAPADGDDDDKAPAVAPAGDGEAADAEADPEAREASRELEEMRQAEAASVDESSRRVEQLLKVLQRAGAASPLQYRISDALDPSRAMPMLPAEDSCPLGAGEFNVEWARKFYDIPVETEPLVLEYIRFFQTSGRKHFVKWLGRASRYLPMMREALREAGLPEDTVFLSMIESGFSPVAYSWARASGLWQFIEATGKRFGLNVDFWVDQRRDPVKATKAAIGYLKELYGEFGDWRLAWAGYNAGAGTIRRAIQADNSTNFWDMVQGRTLRRETKHYVPKLMAAALISKNLQSFGFSDAEIEQLAPLAWEEAEVPEATDLEIVAQAAGVSVDAIRELNPELKRWCTPPSRSGADVYKIRLPVGTRERFADNFAKIAPKDRLTFRVHRVGRGDTLSRIASIYGTPSEAIMRMNDLRDSRRLRLGSELVIPVPRNGSHEQLMAQARRQGFRAAPPDQEVPAAPRARRANGAVAAAGSMRTVKEGNRTKVVYAVASGDSLWTISQHFGVTVDELKGWNGLAGRRRVLSIGQELALYPGASAAASAAPSAHASAPAKGRVHAAR